MMTTDLLSEMVSLSNGRWEPYRSLAGAAQYLALWRLFERHVPAGAEVLDWGAGDGHFSYWLCRAGYRATGYSLDDCTFRDLIAPFPSYRFVRGTDPIRLPFSDSSFDAAASVGVLEHVRETGGCETASLRELARVIRPGGVLIVYHLPNRYSLIDWLARRLPGRRHHHEFRYSRREIERLASSLFDLVRVGRYGLLPRNSLGRLPRPLRRSNALRLAWGGCDRALGFIFSPLCQNYFFVGRTKSASRAGSSTP